MSEFNEHGHPRAADGKYAPKHRAESGVALADPAPLPDLDPNLAPAGTYFVGDPCYAFDSDEWVAILEQTGLAGEDGAGAAHMPDGSIRRMWLVGTAYGDGCYTDDDGTEYGVDSGSLGLVPLDEIPAEKREGLERDGKIVSFAEPVSISEEDGRISFGPITINTGDLDPEPCENCEDETDSTGYCWRCGERCENCGNYDCDGDCADCADCGASAANCDC